MVEGDRGGRHADASVCLERSVAREEDEDGEAETNAGCSIEECRQADRRR
jgi:hypothetical protein